VYPTHLLRLSFATTTGLGEGKRREICVDEIVYIDLNIILKHSQPIFAFGVKD
jgi:hypothetical protein